MPSYKIVYDIVTANFIQYVHFRLYLYM